MKSLYFVICGNYRKIEKSKISYLLWKKFVPSITSSKCKKFLLKEIELLKVLGLIKNI